ncbi:type VI secretion system baseplate subunit TssE [Pyxidicoccus caerfyrddinensis]|jgi:type VI secretion system protein|uniref:type VI secretion system baseplate subunit TssE n=1 Tax=Pyxidicoccus caerfyrddinensis TaxID=2709663 RepID=UPI0013DB5846|nr:type VI secretion system baseplate subunit TssE [Pyxidicoccus caerfyrddinensis]
MGRASFLEKFSGGRRPGSTGRHGLEHVLLNLEAVLNTREGYGFFRRDFGLGDYTEKYGTRELVETLTAELREEIARHEPRLTEVVVTLRGRDAGLWLHFGLSAVLGGTHHKLRLLFDTQSGRVRVEPEP